MVKPSLRPPCYLPVFGPARCRGQAFREPSPNNQGCTHIRSRRQNNNDPQPRAAGDCRERRKSVKPGRDQVVCGLSVYRWVLSTARLDRHQPGALTASIWCLVGPGYSRQSSAEIGSEYLNPAHVGTSGIQVLDLDEANRCGNK